MTNSYEIIMTKIFENFELLETGIVADVGGGHGRALLEFLRANTQIERNRIRVAHSIPSAGRGPQELQSSDRLDLLDVLTRRQEQSAHCSLCLAATLIALS